MCTTGTPYWRAFSARRRRVNGPVCDPTSTTSAVPSLKHRSASPAVVVMSVSYPPLCRAAQRSSTTLGSWPNNTTSVLRGKGNAAMPDEKRSHQSGLLRLRYLARLKRDLHPDRAFCPLCLLDRATSLQAASGRVRSSPSAGPSRLPLSGADRATGTLDGT